MFVGGREESGTPTFAFCEARSACTFWHWPAASIEYGSAARNIIAMLMPLVGSLAALWSHLELCVTAVTYLSQGTNQTVEGIGLLLIGVGYGQKV